MCCVGVLCWCVVCMRDCVLTQFDVRCALCLVLEHVFCIGMCGSTSVLRAVLICCLCIYVVLVVRNVVCLLRVVCVCVVYDIVCIDRHT